MKRLMLTLSIAAIAATPTMASAQTGCRWYDLNCRLSTATSTTVDGSWQVVGHDANGNPIYERRRVDGNGNVVVERARRDGLGRLVIIDRQVVNRNVVRTTRYGVNGTRCKYLENERGYKEQCKYDKNGNLLTGLRGPSSRFGAAGTENCKYQSSDRGYKEQCKYAKTNRAYRASRIDGGKYKPAKVKAARYEATHFKAGKAKGHKD